MEGTGYLVARDEIELHEMLKLIPRGPTCVKCDDQSKLQCPSCSAGQSCQFTVPIDCSQCPKSYCLADTTPTSPSSGSGSGSGGGDGGGGGGGGPSAGPIAGGIVGGIAVIAIITYLVWRFLIKPKRSKFTLSVFEAQDDGASHVEKDGTLRVNRRASTHTVHSIASTVLTRASNIIQIAYIPGVTNRTTPSPNVLVPPVPPIPLHHTQAAQNDEQHFFVPGNLRDSTYSGISGYSDRTSYARTSFAPRSSIASTIYGKQAQVLAPAQTGMRAKPTVVSVKTGSNGLNAPPVPNIDTKYLRPKSSASTFSVGSTFLNSANTATQARAQVVKVSSSVRRKPTADSISSPSENECATFGGDLDPKVLRVLNTLSPIAYELDASTPDQGPFSDPQSQRLSTRHESNSEKRKSARGTSPFGDEHATRE